MWKRLKIPTTPSHRCTNGFSKLRIQVLTVSQGLQQTLPLRIRLLLSYWYQWMTLFVFDWQGSFLEYPVTWMITNKIGWIMICQNIYKNIYIYIYIHTYMYYCIHVFSSIFTNIIYFQTCTSHLPFGGLLGDLTSNLLLSFLLATDALRESSPLSSRLAMKSQQGILSWFLSHFDGRLKKNQGIWEQDIHCLLATLPNLWTFWMSFLHFPSQCVWIDKQLSANLKVKLRPTVMTCTNYTLQKDGTNKN